MVYITAAQYDFRSAINEAMLAAMESQCREGGNAFADYAGWLSQGIADAAMGEEETVRAMATDKKGGYIIDHRGYTDHDFMNLFTGGFYDYADFQMAVCFPERNRTAPARRDPAGAAWRMDWEKRN